MDLNITIYAILAAITMLIALYFIVNNLFKTADKRSPYSFTILSFSVFIISLANLLMIISGNQNLIYTLSYFLQAGVYIFPAALFHYTVDILEYNFFKKEAVKYLFYITSSAIIFYILLPGNLEIVRVSYGYTIGIGQAMVLGIAYILPLLLLTITYITYNLIKTVKANYPAARIIILLIGVSVFTLATAVTRPLEYAYGFGIPYNSILMFVLFLTIAVSDFITGLKTEALTFSKMFEAIDDCIMIVDKNGKVLDINEHMKQMLFGKINRLQEDDRNKIRARMLKTTASKEKVDRLFEFFANDSPAKLNIDIDCVIGSQTKFYNVTATPIIYGKKKILGKVAVFRDITEKKMLQERLREESIKDFLTGAFNRRYFYHILNNAIKNFDRYDTPFSILLLDIDGFKKLNDRYGHLKGDWLLREVTNILSRNTRKGLDSVVRYGGDEFIVLLSKTALRAAARIAARIIEDFKDIDRKGTCLSIGVSQFCQGMCGDDIINEADSAMYKAKLKDHDAIVVSSPKQETAAS